MQKSGEGCRVVSSSAKLAKSEDATGGFAADDDDHDHFNDNDDDDDDDDGDGGDNLLQSWRKVKMQLDGSLLMMMIMIISTTTTTTTTMMMVMVAIIFCKVGEKWRCNWRARC